MKKALSRDSAFLVARDSWLVAPLIGELAAEGGLRGCF